MTLVTLAHKEERESLRFEQKHNGRYRYSKRPLFGRVSNPQTLNLYPLRCGQPSEPHARGWGIHSAKGFATDLPVWVFLPLESPHCRQPVYPKRACCLRLSGP